MTDPRIAPVEDNLLTFVEAMSRQPRFVVEPADDVLTSHSDVAFPMFNSISGARFAPDVAAARAGQVVASYVERGLPFMWWLTPSTTSPELEAALDAAGLDREDVPGMHVTLGERRTPVLPEGVTLETVHQPQPFARTMVDAFEMPSELEDEFGALLTAFDDTLLFHVLATVDGRPAATGSAWRSGPTVGLYNIATLAPMRGRGLGYAVTARLMDLAADRGATDAVLHASEMGRPVYERLGFVEVCTVPHFVWMPAS